MDSCSVSCSAQLKRRISRAGFVSLPRAGARPAHHALHLALTPSIHDSFPQRGTSRVRSTRGIAAALRWARACSVRALPIREQAGGQKGVSRRRPHGGSGPGPVQCWDWGWDSGARRTAKLGRTTTAQAASSAMLAGRLCTRLGARAVQWCSDLMNSTRRVYPAV